MRSSRRTRAWMLLVGVMLPVTVFAAVFLTSYRPPLDLPRPFSIPSSAGPTEPPPDLVEEAVGRSVRIRPLRRGRGPASTRYTVHHPPSRLGWGATVIAEPPRGWALQAAPSGEGTVLTNENPDVCRREGRCPEIWVNLCDAAAPDGGSPASVVREEIEGTDGPTVRPVGGRLWRRGEYLLQPFPGGGCLRYSIGDEGLDRDPRTVARLAQHITAYFGRRAVTPRGSSEALVLARHANRLVLEAPAAALSADTAECRDVGCQDVESRGHLVTRRAAGAPPYADVRELSELDVSGVPPPTVVLIGSLAFTSRPAAMDCSASGITVASDRRWLGFDQGLLLPTSRWLLSYAEPRRAGNVTILEWRSYFDGGRAELDSSTGRLLGYDRLERQELNEVHWDRTVARMDYPKSIDRIDVRGRCPLKLFELGTRVNGTDR